MRDISKLEKSILNREMKVIEKQLQKLDAEIKAIFEKYGALRGHHRVEFAKYIREKVISADELYYSGYITTAKIETQTSKIPDELKEAILDWAISDFMNKVDNVAELANYLE